MVDSPTPTEKLATKCPHTDKPEKARGMCQSCYRAAKKAEDLESGKVKLDEETGVEEKTQTPVDLDFVNDPEAVKEFYKIMWGWLREAEKAKEPIYVTVKGRGGKEEKVRDLKLEARLQETADQRAMKAATVLGRAYIVERHSEEKPKGIEVDGIGDMVRGWAEVAVKSQEKKNAKELD